jgi:hypothetical protein
MRRRQDALDAALRPRSARRGRVSTPSTPTAPGLGPLSHRRTMSSGSSLPSSTARPGRDRRDRVADAEGFRYPPRAPATVSPPSRVVSASGFSPGWHSEMRGTAEM